MTGDGSVPAGGKVTGLRLTRHADHDPVLICRPALGYGLCELLEPDEDGEAAAG